MTHRKLTPELLARAKMNQYQLNTGVVRATDEKTSKLRVMVSGSYSDDWGDCIGLGFMSDMEPGLWHVAHLSPARARIVAYQLLERAKRMEKEEPSSVDIDTEDAL